METKKKKGVAPPRYDDAFKAGAVQMVTVQGRQPTEVARELGICIDTLRSWLKAAGVQMGQASRSNRIDTQLTLAALDMAYRPRSAPQGQRFLERRRCNLRLCVIQ